MKRAHPFSGGASQALWRGPVPQDHPIRHWLIRHAAFVVTKYFPGADNMAGLQRLHGEHSRERITEFGEHLLFFVPSKRRGKLDPLWRRVFLGRAWHSDSNYIGLADGSVTTARAMARRTADVRWQRERVLRVTGTPIGLHALYEADDAVQSGPSPHLAPGSPG